MAAMGGPFLYLLQMSPNDITLAKMMWWICEGELEYEKLSV